jgi:RNase P subunit RPR2
VICQNLHTLIQMQNKSRVLLSLQMLCASCQTPVLTYAWRWGGGRTSKCQSEGAHYLVSKWPFLFKSPFQEITQPTQSSDYLQSCHSCLKQALTYSYKTVSGNRVRFTCAQGARGMRAPIHVQLIPRWRGGVRYTPQQLNLARSVNFCLYYICFCNI